MNFKKEVQVLEIVINTRETRVMLRYRNVCDISKFRNVSALRKVQLVSWFQKKTLMLQSTLLQLKRVLASLFGFGSATERRSASAASRRFLTGVMRVMKCNTNGCTQDVAFNAHVSKNTIQWTLSNIDQL